QARRDVEGELEKIASLTAVELINSAHMVPPADFARFHKANQQKQRATQGHLNAINAELYMRPAMSFGSLFFVLVGCTVGLWFSRRDYLSAFITCFMPIVFVYYPIQLCCTNLAKDGKFLPASELWAANAVLGLISIFLFRRLLKN